MTNLLEKKKISYILIYTYEEKRPKIYFVDKNVRAGQCSLDQWSQTNLQNPFLVLFWSLYQRILPPQISALFEPITPSTSALLLLLTQKERCIHGDSTASSCTYLVHVYRRRFNHGDPHFTNLCLFSSSSSLIKTFVFLQLLADFKE